MCGTSQAAILVANRPKRRQAAARHVDDDLAVRSRIGRPRCVAFLADDLPHPCFLLGGERLFGVAGHYAASAVALVGVGRDHV